MTSRIDYICNELKNLQNVGSEDLFKKNLKEIKREIQKENTQIQKENTEEITQEMSQESYKETLQEIEKKSLSLVFFKDDVAVNKIEDSMFDGQTKEDLFKCALQLESIYTAETNRFLKARAALFLSRIYNYYLPNSGELINIGTIPYCAILAIENQQYDKAIDILMETSKKDTMPEAIMKILGLAYWKKAFSIIEEQVEVSFFARFPQLFNITSLEDYNVKNPAYFKENVEHILMPVRIEHTSCVGSDIFFLSMDRPHRSRCINISVDLFDNLSQSTKPPISIMVRPITERGIRLTSIDLGISKLVVNKEDLFNMQSDDLSLLKAALIVSGIVPPGLKNINNICLLELLDKFMSENNTYKGFEVITSVTDIPRGSGLAVSTSLLAGLILALMRFSGQSPLDDTISSSDKMQVVARCIYGEWLGGSGGGWQDCGGLWGGFKKVTGQYGDPEYEKDSIGSFLPKFEELEIDNRTEENIISSMVLVNGGTGQDVGPVLRMITEQYALKDKRAWNARIMSENRFDQIISAIFEGDVKKLGQLELEDFEDRIKISMLSNNLYHQKVYKKLKEIFKDSLWGYDSTGGRAGAGGIFFVDPIYRNDFEKAFIAVSEEVQDELKGQMHFSSGPLVYSYKINKKGIKVIPLKKNMGDNLIKGWMDSSILTKIQRESFGDIYENVIAKCSFNHRLFEKMQKEYCNGKISIKNNIRVEADKIGQIDVGKSSDNIMKMPDIGSEEYKKLFKEGTEFLKEPMAYVILNGGESTRFGVSTIRSLNPAFLVSGKYCSMIELKMRHLNYVKDKFKTPVYPVFVNSFFTDQNTMDVLNKNQYYGIERENVYGCIHQVSHRLIPKVEDLIYAHEVLREKKITSHEEELEKQYLETMTAWALEKGEGNIYTPEGINKLYTFSSPGHYYSFMSIVSNFTLGFLLEKGVKRLVVSSNDNLLATVDPALLAFHLRNGKGITSEIVPRLYDCGGAPVIINNNVEILEDFSFPDKETLWKTPYFNPITTWLEVDYLLELLNLTSEDLIGAAHGDKEKQGKCLNAVEEIADRIKTYVVIKYICEDMGKGIIYKYPVIQFEKLYGDLVGLLEPLFVVVPKVLRHTQVKSIDHLYQINTDRALEILIPQLGSF